MREYLMVLSLLLPLPEPFSLPSIQAAGLLPDDVRLVNEGKMTVAFSGEVYVRGAVRMVGAETVEVDLQGRLTTEGNFYFDPQGAAGHVFDPASEGRLRFVPNDEPGVNRRLITTYSDGIDRFDRSVHYIAFPHLEIGVDTLELPARMGIDALSVSQTTAFGGRHKKLLLKSDAYDGKAFDASLRITGRGKGDGSSAHYVAGGAVVVERCIAPYRPPGSDNANAVYVAFATPFDRQYSAYFAANWVRQMRETSTGHVPYPYGNERLNGTIVREQYLHDYDQRFEAGRGYLIRLRPDGYDYGALHETNGIRLPEYTGEHSAFAVDKYVFDGTPPYSGLTDVEQLFANDVLFDRTIDVSQAENASTINWVIGNSYAAPISIGKLIDRLAESDLVFTSNLYFLPGGSVAYIPIPMVDDGGTISLTDAEVIPGMSYFMLRLAKGCAQRGSLTLGKELLAHDGETPHGLRAAKTYDNEFVLRVSPVYQDNFYDLAGVGLRPGYSAAADGRDIQKMSADTGEAFSLYSLSSDGLPLAVNMLPETIEAVALGFAPGEAAGPFRLQTERMESLRTEGLWLEDLKTGQTADLLQTGGEYLFDCEAGDEPLRFRLRFLRSETGLETNQPAGLQLFCSRHTLYLNGLTEADMGAVLTVADMKGRVCHQMKIEDITLGGVDLGRLPKGAYIARVQGNRPAILKVIL